MVHARSKSSAIAWGEYDAGDAGFIDMVMSQFDADAGLIDMVGYVSTAVDVQIIMNDTTWCCTASLKHSKLSFWSDCQ